MGVTPTWSNERKKDTSDFAVRSSYNTWRNLAALVSFRCMTSAKPVLSQKLNPDVSMMKSAADWY
jgi:hypothetical protein